MAKQSDPERLKKIYQMLFEMATGNTAFRIKDNGNDELKSITVELNEIAQELQTIIATLGYVNPYYSYQNLIQLIFVLDENFILVGFNDRVPLKLKYKSDTILSSDFGKLIAKQSKEIWKAVEEEVIGDLTYHSTLQLIFITGDNHLMPAFCTVSRLLYHDKIIVSSVSTILDDLLDTSEHLSYSKVRKQSEAIVVQQLHDYILSNLSEPLPSLHHLSKMFVTEEHILKNGFRAYFKTSVYNFYHEERLKRAHTMILQTTEPLKLIAFTNGFKSYLNFYKAFKKRFGYSPSDLSRPEQESEI